MLSWNGTAFEYFMPPIFLAVYENSLEYESLRFAAREQLRRSWRGMWGKSECGYCELDLDGNYKYKAVGITSLGIERGLDADRIYAPYAVFLCSLCAPEGSVRCLRDIARKAGYGVHGFYESFTATDGGAALTLSYMSHHVGMSILAAENAVFDRAVSRRFMRDPDCSAYSELLKEKIPFNARIPTSAGQGSGVDPRKTKKIRF